MKFALIEKGVVANIIVAVDQASADQFGEAVLLLDDSAVSINDTHDKGVFTPAPIVDIIEPVAEPTQLDRIEAKLDTLLQGSGPQPAPAVQVIP